MAKRSRSGQRRTATPALRRAPATVLVRRGIQSAGIAFDVLSALAAEPEAAGLTAVARRAGLSASQTHRYLASLIRAGFARQNPDSGLYDLGPEAIQIGLAALARTDVFALADPAIAEFTRTTGRSSLLAARGPLGPTVVRWHAGRIPVITSVSVGSVLPYLRSATGRVFLSFLPENETAKEVSRELTTARMQKPFNIRAIRARVRADMSASVDELLIAGLRATAAPILDIQGRVALVATVMATRAFDPAEDAAIIEQLKTLCRRLTENIGGRWSASG
ncbi:MAG: IclR family transcriptional regulator [Pseudorhodoplanes sp.]|nr:IclR family transcriptional regulator [Pseudorhodoplanes sp.]